MSHDRMADERQPQPFNYGERSSSRQSILSRRRPCTGDSPSLLAPFQVIAPKFRFIPLIGCSIILLNDAEFFFKQTAMFRAIEAMYCIQYYEVENASIWALGRDIPEKLCKSDEIEKKVSTTYGWIMFFRMLPCLFTAIPLGYLADKAGRRPVLVLHKVGTIVFVSVEIIVYLSYPALPIWVLYVSAFGALVGANFDLSLAMLFASYTDVMPLEKQRTTLFFVTTAMQYVGQAFFPIISGWLINLDGKGGTPQISLFVSLATALSALGIAAFLFPETLRKEKSEIEDEPLMSRSGAENEVEFDFRDTEASPSFAQRLNAQIRSSRARSHEIVAKVGLSTLTLLILSMFLTSTAIKAIDMLGLMQYPVVKFDWAFSDVTFVISLQAIVYTINYLILLPGYTRIGSYLELCSSTTSFSTMILSSLILITGSICLGLSTTGRAFVIAVAFYTLGAGLPVIIQAYIANHVGKDQTARVLATLSTFAVARKLAAVSLGPAVFNAGVASDFEELQGLLFFFCAILFLGAVVAVAIIASRSTPGKLNEKPLGQEVALGDVSGGDNQSRRPQTASDVVGD